MPYIPQHRRSDLSNNNSPETAGELNFLIFSLIKRYSDQHGVSYQVFNDIMGAVDGAKAEFYRRIVGPYEDLKILANGDVD